MKTFFAFCLLAILMIAFSPPGSASLPIHKDMACYVIEQPTIQTATVQEAIEFQHVNYLIVDIVHFSLPVCGNARNWPGVILVSYLKNLQSDAGYNLRTGYNKISGNNYSALDSYPIFYQPRDGLRTAAA